MSYENVIKKDLSLGPNLVFNLILFHCILNHDRRFAAAISRDEIQVHEKIFAKMSYHFFFLQFQFERLARTITFSRNFL